MSRSPALRAVSGTGSRLRRGSGGASRSSTTRSGSPSTRAGGGNDVGGVSGEEEPAVLHRFADKGAHLHYVLLEDIALLEGPAFVGVEARVHLLPDAFVGPVVHVVVGITLEVEALDLGRARANQGEATLVKGVDKLLSRGWSLDEDAEPSEWVGPDVLLADVLGDGGPAGPEEAVAPGHEVAGDLLFLRIPVETDLPGLQI